MVLLYGFETWPLTTEDMRKLLVFRHRCLTIGKIWWENFVSSQKLGIRHWIQSLDHALNENMLRRPGDVLRVTKVGLTRKLLLQAVDFRKMVRGVHSMTWEKYEKFSQCKCS